MLRIHRQSDVAADDVARRTEPDSQEVGRQRLKYRQPRMLYRGVMPHVFTDNHSAGTRTMKASTRSVPQLAVQITHSPVGSIFARGCLQYSGPPPLASRSTRFGATAQQRSESFSRAAVISFARGRCSLSALLNTTIWSSGDRASA